MSDVDGDNDEHVMRFSSIICTQSVWRDIFHRQHAYQLFARNCSPDHHRTKRIEKQINRSNTTKFETNESKLLVNRFNMYKTEYEYSLSMVYDLVWLTVSVRVSV